MSDRARALAADLDARADGDRAAAIRERLVDDHNHSAIRGP